ncbi:hypothetical protein O181_103102 [Austropuccinia psidii MF-1]|uniref:Uncharacterized protein n=1 Tax=Austropuccinia psidii MF-1 TaxID=1389203 RepID=A0A9Q3JKG6_9BASI|nr:hypothetical protein [Austropuccinia psidii MF-1]
MTPTRSGRQDCQPRGEAQIEDSRTSTSSQRLPSTFETIIDAPEADINAIPVVRSEKFPTGNNRNIPVSIQELAYGGKEAGVGTSAKCLDRHNELISSSEEVHCSRKYRGSCEGLDTHSLKRTSPTEKAWLKNQRAQWKLPKPQQGKICLKKFQTRARKPQRTIRKGKKNAKGKAKPKLKKALPTELQNSQ